MSEPTTAVLLRAAELTAEGLPQQAIDLLRPLVAANPRHAEAWCRLAAAHLDLGEADQALDSAKRAMILDGEPAWPQRLAALALSDLGRPAEAAVAARESVRRKPGDWRCYVVLAEVLANSPDGAVEAFDAALHASQLASTEPRAFQVLGDAALRMRDWGTAEHAYRAAIKLDPSDADSKANLATVQRRRSARPAPPQLNKPQVWRALRTLSLLLVGGGLLALIAGMPRPTPYLGFFTGALVLCCVVVGLRLRPFTVLFGLRKLVVTVSLLAASAVILTGWTVALLFGATTMQPLVLSWLCAVVGGALVYVGGGRKR
ncbi:tetratricopeptide repeat protein [Lentzea sp. NEAU-D13]|uniref:Tetratricopeptide repeat protein n=1 Tax=Lentzea alba TaxID=2714351 RepID=A0A7C9VQA9_9PSEU|nr:tetratricopeptide repeat protein [Lentzea alba]NGY61193.1 tetratricopeptide repeat protein [Lentzea alba]